MTDELKMELPVVFNQERRKDSLCQVKFFALWSHWTWYGIEYDPEDRIFFGFVLSGIADHVCPTCGTCCNCDARLM